MTRAILINGVPASGKTTVARMLASELRLPVLELDAVKEVLFDELGHRDADREWGRALGRASIGSIWSLLAGFPAESTVIVEAWLRLPPHDAVLHGLERAGIEEWVEVWCHTSVDVLISRYAGRTRHPGHPSPADYVDELRGLAAVAGPMARSPHLSVDTTYGADIDSAAMAAWVRERLAV